MATLAFMMLWLSTGGDRANTVNVSTMAAIVAAGAGAVVEVGGPGVGVAGVVGEVAEGIAEFSVAGPAESDGAHFARLAG